MKQVYIMVQDASGGEAVDEVLLQAAKESKDSEMRLMYVTGYNIACWFEQRMRMSYKPVKPVQNETFEYVDPEGNYKLLIEEVGF